MEFIKEFFNYLAGNKDVAPAIVDFIVAMGQLLVPIVIGAISYFVTYFISGKKEAAKLQAEVEAAKLQNQKLEMEKTYLNDKYKAEAKLAEEEAKAKELENQFKEIELRYYEKKMKEDIKAQKLSNSKVRLENKQKQIQIKKEELELRSLQNRLP